MSETYWGILERKAPFCRHSPVSFERPITKLM